MAMWAIRVDQIMSAKAKEAPEMKPWQHGIPLRKLEQLAKQYERYNSFAYGPFSEVKKNTIAQMIHEGTFKTLYGPKKELLGYCQETWVKASTDIEMYPGVVIGRKNQGDQIINRLCVIPGKEFEYTRELATLFQLGTGRQHKNCWIYIQEEDECQRRVVNFLEFKKIGTKVTTFSDIYGIYYKDTNFGNWMQMERPHPKVSPYEHVALNRLKLTIAAPQIKRIATKLETLDWKNHYSNSNKDNAWGAIALRGYAKDPTLIEKPACMSPKWQEAHKDQVFKLQDTTLMKEFEKELKPILDLIPGKKDRIRFMRLRANNERNAELTRHTDLVESEAGFADGKIARVHIPIITNPKVHFYCWNSDGVQLDKNFKIGEVFVLDIRKPHRVVNEGKEDRIHLVIDVYSNEELRKLIKL
jgi:hypothetical protein